MPNLKNSLIRIQSKPEYEWLIHFDESDSYFADRLRELAESDGEELADILLAISSKWSTMAHNPAGLYRDFVYWLLNESGLIDPENKECCDVVASRFAAIQCVVDYGESLLTALNGGCTKLVYDQLLDGIHRERDSQ